MWHHVFYQLLLGGRQTEQLFQPQIPKAWNDAEVETYELPLSYAKPAQYMSAAEYYTIPARTIYRSGSVFASSGQACPV